MRKKFNRKEKAAYEAFIARISAPPCPRKLTEAEVKELRKKGRIQ